MARKLKSDKLLFTSTLVLVCASLVMVYSSSAVIGLEQYHSVRPISSGSRPRSPSSGWR
jgi:cell division protein FtsW (lipid II flippase)